MVAVASSSSSSLPKPPSALLLSPPPSCACSSPPHPRSLSVVWLLPMDALRKAEADGIIDLTIFEQILEMDDDEDHEFSIEIINSFYDQAETTFGDMDKAIEKKDIAELSQLGHFLKGSSAAVGVVRVKDICEKIQNLGHQLDESGKKPIEVDTALEAITKLLPEVKEEYQKCKIVLKEFYSQYV
ncbi:histidine-phosphotransfer domain, HPT domain-containing protein [Myxozyma melibiosi]|uniref:Histidine-phosphotransfer domain, HPT domain-containing protein n=1 Tax=Myxozyma melibiosi TaxID=54550 RepID=A0ABR1F8E7_9ASCO